ncbi:MAG: Hint domain-containing protein [Paracoccaceae bacterium]
MAATFFAREDKNNANNPSLNLENANSVELMFVETGGGDDVNLETNGGGADPNTLVEIGGTQYSFIFEFTGTWPVGSNKVPDSIEGDDVALITILDYPSSGDSTRFAFDPTGEATQADMDALGNGAIPVDSLDETPPPTPVCFVEGTLILTPDGERPVETLRAGDPVTIAERDVAELRWVARSHYRLAETLMDPRLRPVRIPAGLLGRGKPHSDLWVSRQHRVVLGGWQTELHVGAPQVFIPAVHLVGSGSTTFETRATSYYHLLFDRHEIVVSNGLETESLFPGEEALRMVGPKARRELDAVLQAGAECRQTALTTLSRHEADVLRPVQVA